MAEVTAGIWSWSPRTHSTTAPSMVKLMMVSSRDMGPIWRSFSFACFGASGVSVISGGTSCAHVHAPDQLLVLPTQHTHSYL